MIGSNSAAAEDVDLAAAIEVNRSSLYDSDSPKL